MKTLALIIFVFAAAILPIVAQSNSKKSLPRVDAIRQDEKYFRLGTSCDHHVIYTERRGGKWIFLSDREGKNAWMNLDGHNVELRLAKTVLLHRNTDEADATYTYRYKNVKVTVILLQAPTYIYPEPAKLVIESGSSRRTIHAFIGAQCHP